MKSILVKLGVVLIIGLFIFSNAEVWGQDWKLYGATENYLSYYDTQSIIHPSKNIVRVWIRTNFTEKGVLNWVGKFGKKYENLSYSIILIEINCAEKMNHLLSLTDYDNKGRVIASHSFKTEWDFIIPESTTDGLYKEVCK